MWGTCPPCVAKPWTPFPRAPCGSPPPDCSQTCPFSKKNWKSWVEKHQVSQLKKWSKFKEKTLPAWAKQNTSEDCIWHYFVISVRCSFGENPCKQMTGVGLENQHARKRRMVWVQRDCKKVILIAVNCMIFLLFMCSHLAIIIVNLIKIFRFCKLPFIFIFMPFHPPWFVAWVTGPQLNMYLLRRTLLWIVIVSF